MCRRTYGTRQWQRSCRHSLNSRHLVQQRLPVIKSWCGECKSDERAKELCRRLSLSPVGTRTIYPCQLRCEKVRAFLVSELVSDPQGVASFFVHSSVRFHGFDHFRSLRRCMLQLCLRTFSDRHWRRYRTVATDETHTFHPRPPRSTHCLLSNTPKAQWAQLHQRLASLSQSTASRIQSLFAHYDQGNRVSAIRRIIQRQCTVGVVLLLSP